MDPWSKQSKNVQRLNGRSDERLAKKMTKIETKHDYIKLTIELYCFRFAVAGSLYAENHRSFFIQTPFREHRVTKKLSLSISIVLI